MTAEKLTERPSRSTWWLERTGGSFLALALFVVMLISFPFSAAALLAIQLNAAFTTEQFTAIAVVGIIAVCISDIFLLGITYGLTREMRDRLNRWAQGKPLTAGKEELDSWKQITTIDMRYAIAVSVAGLFVSMVLIGYQYYINIIAKQPVYTFDQFVYTFLGGQLYIIAIIPLTTPILERLLEPARIILLPPTIGEQLSETQVSTFQFRLYAIFISIILVTILLMAPIGYQTTILALNRNADTSHLLGNLQTELITISISVIVIGLSYTYLLSRQLIKPIGDLIKVFKQIETGDVKQRARVTSADEVARVAASFNRMVDQLETIQQSLEKRIEYRTEQLRASNEVGKIASTILDPDTLVTQTVNLIANAFSYYFVAIFLISDERWAELKDATGTPGEVLKENRHRILISENNLVGAAIVKKEAQIALDVGEGAKIFYNPLLPYTRSELTLPLVVGDRVIGALDVQSTREADFNPEDISALQGMANQVAIAIENARLFKEMDEALEELRQANRQYVVTSWSEKLKGEKMEFATRELGARDGEELQEIQIGLNLRDQSIGQIRLQTDAEWTQEDQAWVESLATQVAISLENARLIEESQESALRERLSASIVQKIWASNSIDGILQTAVRELGRALEASEATIELKVEET